MTRLFKTKLIPYMLLTILLFGLIFFPARSMATVSTKEPTGDYKTVYVAGNPDMYPIEYYNEDSEAFEGILPKLLDNISAKTGLEFTYVSAGHKDQRKQLAQNKQVDMISGCKADDPWLKEDKMIPSSIIYDIPTEKGSIKVCFAFTDIADEALVSSIEGALSQITAQELSGMSIDFLTNHSPQNQYPWLPIVITGIIILLIIIIIVVTVKLRRCRRAFVKDERTDPLTGIWNKNYFIDFFEKYISDQYRNLYCIVYIAFDIGRVNQYYGEGAAEEQLRYAANELELSVRDNEVVARVSGGGFAIARLTIGERDTEKWINQLLDRLNHFTDQYGKDYRPIFKAGIYRLHSSDRNCETALFNARQGYQQAISKDIPFSFAKADYLKRESDQLQLKKQTLDALQNREFRMFLQLIVSAKDGKICGGEAVSRWEHPQKGLLFPGSYIELMETEGTIAELDFYIFEEVCRQLEKWQSEGYKLYLSCNFARITIGRETFLQRVSEIASRFNFNHSYLIMEITEDAMETNKEMAFKNISSCKEMGFRIALDDAGEGYTSFADLRDYPIDVVKIDRSLLNSTTTARGAALLRGITSLVHNLRMSVLCEGAETEEQVNMIKKIGCDYIQGYYFYRPLPLKEIERILQEKLN